MTRFSRSIRSCAQGVAFKIQCGPKKRNTNAPVSNQEHQYVDGSFPSFPVRTIQDQNALIAERKQPKNEENDHAYVEDKIGEESTDSAIRRLLLSLSLESRGYLG